MKQSSAEYAEFLIQEHGYNVKYAIKDVEHTIEAIDWHEFETPNKEIEYYTEALNHLKSKV